jgi:endoglucanase
MESILSFFLAIGHFLLLTWATIHPAVPPQHHALPVREITSHLQTQVRYQGEKPSGVVLASVRNPDAGFWHTSGSQILDERGRAVRIQGINWYGFETVRQIPGGLTVQDYRTILKIIRGNGFNTVRIPLSNQMLEQPIVPSSIAFFNERGAINEPLRRLTSVQILDQVVEYAGTLGLKVILDNHRSEAGDSAEQSGLWYTAEYPESAWIADWQRLARRYVNNSTVIGFDLRNEPHNSATGGACWDCGGDRDWHLAAQRAGDAVLAINPRLLIFVEGVDTVDGDSYWWGGNLQGVRRSPVQLAVPNQLVYSPHTYGPNEYHQRWFNASTTPASLAAVWTRHWGFISQRGIAPVWVGEFGTGNRVEDIAGSAAPGSQAQWFQSLVGYLARNPDISWTSWALNGEDANGLLTTSYDAPANPLKMQALNSIMSSPASSSMAVAASPSFR